MARIHKKRKSFFRRFISFVMTVVIICAIAGAAGVFYAKSKLDNISHVELDTSHLQQQTICQNTGILSYLELIQGI